jgi:hypothetical protein
VPPADAAKVAGASVATGKPDAADAEGARVPGKADAFIPVNGGRVAGNGADAFASDGARVIGRSGANADDGASVTAGTADAFVPFDGGTVAGKADAFAIEGTSVPGRSGLTSAEGESVTADALVPFNKGLVVDGKADELAIEGVSVAGRLDEFKTGAGELVSLAGVGNPIVGATVADAAAVGAPVTGVTGITGIIEPIEGTDVGKMATGVAVGNGTKEPPTSRGSDVGALEFSTADVGDGVAGPTGVEDAGKVGLGVGAGVRLMRDELPYNSCLSRLPKSL